MRVANRKSVPGILLGCLFAIFTTTVADAHESQPGTLELREIAALRYEVIWRAPIYFGEPHPARVELPADWTTVDEPTVVLLADSQVFRRVVTVGSQGVEGSIVRFAGLEKTVTLVFVRLTRLDGASTSAMAGPAKPYVEFQARQAWYARASDYVILGFDHILRGVDHLLFVLGLLLIVRGRMMLFKTITAFTAAHSISLAAATLGYARAPLPPLNAAIALSILFLGPEIVRSWRGESSLTIRYPWVVAFLFGLLHGFGFASGLSTVGMPAGELPIALLCFNLGVEFGQLVFVSTALSLARSFAVLEVRWPRWVEALPGYTVGSLGAYWTIQRTVILFGGLR